MVIKCESSLYFKGKIYKINVLDKIEHISIYKSLKR